MPDIPVNNCCGCTACFNACSTSAIKMVSDHEGFAYPVIDNNLCNNCLRCQQVCPMLSPPLHSDKFHESVVAQSKDEKVLSESTSGGFIDALNKYVIHKLQGYACGVLYNNDFLPVHVLTDSSHVAEGFRNSKYAQSELGTIFKEVKSLLNNNKFVVFTGTPCQVAGLKSFLRKDYPNLITVDLVCRSIPSPLLWKEYITWQENKYQSKVKSVYCRKKTYGYHSGTLEIDFENGRHYSGSNRVDYYMKSFHSDICSRPSCYDCQFKTKHRSSDFTVFDSWSPQEVSFESMQDNDKGYSNVIAHSKKAADILDCLDDIVLIKADVHKMFQFTGSMESKSIELKDVRRSFYVDLEKLGFEKTVRKYVSVTVKDRMIERVKPAVYKVKRIFKR